MKTFLATLTAITTVLIFSATALAAPPKKLKSRFYDFGGQVIDGEIKKPTALYIQSRDRVKFDRLLRLKKSFLPRLFSTSKEKTFK
jgi:hypothetical protein